MKCVIILCSLLLQFGHSSTIVHSVLSDESQGWFIPLFDTDTEPSYLNSWAVSFTGSQSEADSIAKYYGLVNRGKVGNLKDVYHFTLFGKEDTLQHKLTKVLQNDTRIKYAVQQLKKVHFQRRFRLPSDPLWSNQWSLYNTGHVTATSKLRDLNVVHSWMQGVSGRGIVVSVVDDGLFYSHPDLKANYDKAASYNYIEYINNPTPSNPKRETHGTSCAGIIAMQKDTGMCGVGVAFEANIGGIRFNLNSSSDIIESSALGHQSNYIDIYSNSWGPSDSGYSVDGPGELLTATLENGIKYGRNGLGNIYVWASGNGGQNGDSCTADGYASSMYTIAVGSANEKGFQAEYDESCAAKMAVTYSFNSATYSVNSAKCSGQVPTTLSYQQCTETFTGSSASAPMTAGVIALALNINSSLTWRDVQYLIVYTSDTSKLRGGNWTINGRGLKVSHQFGFGAIDAEAMVTRARYWTTVPERVSCFIRPKMKVGTLYYNEPVKTFFKVNTRKCLIKYLEHVVIRMSLHISIDDQYDYPDYYGEDYVEENPFIIFFKGPRRGALTVDLRSPHGTKSYLLPKRKYDFVNNEGYHQWPFTSVQHWGEDPFGIWNISVRFHAEGGHVKMTNLSMTLYGTEEIPEAIQRIPSQCDQSCARGCSYGDGSEYCDECRDLRMSDTLLCVSSCPNKYCNVAGYCEECPLGAGVITAAVLVSITGVATIVGGIIVGIFVYWKWKNREGYTEF